MDQQRKRQILKAEAYYAEIDKLARDLAERGFYVLGGIHHPPVSMEPAEMPETDNAPAYWKTPESR
jgi:hypothetical protein